MKTVFIVTDKELANAKSIENTLSLLSVDAGIIFVSVSVIQDPLSDHTNRKILYRLVIGCEKCKDPESVKLIVQSYIKPKIEDTSQTSIEVFRGVSNRNFSLDK